MIFIFDDIKKKIKIIKDENSINVNEEKIKENTNEHKKINDNERENIIKKDIIIEKNNLKKVILENMEEKGIKMKKT